MPDDSIEPQVQLRPGLAFDYSDPEEDEQYLEASIRGARDRTVGSPELARAIRDWTSFYHLSPHRADLLRPLEHLISGDVLEVGGGCGAITRYLGETSRSVMAIEGSLRRARIMAARCRGLPNVSVHCDNFEDFPFGDRRFDAVVCIGVIEYANKFFRAENGFDRMLARMGELLSENGVLVIAIENRLGLKYFAGAPEDHTNQLYQGIQDLYDPKSVLTLGRGEWLHRLNQQDLEPLHWFYPWPDYKTPELIVSEAAFQEPGLDLSPWISRHVHGRQDDPGAHRFSEALVWPVLARNGLAGDLANSFLLVARRAGSIVDAKFPALFWEFETECHPTHATHPKSAAREGIFTAQLFWRTAAGGYSEAASRSAKGHLESARQTISVTLPPLGEAPSRPAASSASLIGRIAQDAPDSTKESSCPAALCANSIEALRFDMSNRPGIARLHCLCLKTSDGAALWTWNGSAESLQSSQRVDASFASHGGAVVMKLFSHDPSITLPIPPQILGSLHHGATLEMELEWMDPLQYLRDLEQL